MSRIESPSSDHKEVLCGTKYELNVSLLEFLNKVLFHPSLFDAELAVKSEKYGISN